MIIYLGDTRARATLAAMERRRAGIMVIRGRLRARTTAVRWAYDNGAYADFKAGRAFDLDTWQRDLDAIAALPTREAPDFCVLPDIVAGGLRSLELSLSWLPRVRGTHWHWYLAVQDGMTAGDLPRTLPDWLAGLFVGGSTDWKIRTSRYWRTEANRRGLLCHVGRVGTAPRVRLMKDVGVGSIDSSLPIMGAEQWGRFWGAVDSEVDARHGGLFADLGEHARP